jgi:hypothetical protein
LQQIYLYTGIAFIVGALAAWIIRTLVIVKLKQSLSSFTSLYETEKLRKELLNKENLQLHKTHDAAKAELIAKVEKLTSDNKRIIEDLLLLQKSNEETEALLQAGEPELYNLKIKLIEANNEIARYKALIKTGDVTVQ